MGVCFEGQVFSVNVRFAFSFSLLFHGFADRLRFTGSGNS
jgi:hypothetical protein